MSEEDRTDHEAPAENLTKSLCEVIERRAERAGNEAAAFAETYLRDYTYMLTRGSSTLDDLKIEKSVQARMKYRQDVLMGRVNDDRSAKSCIRVVMPTEKLRALGSLSGMLTPINEDETQVVMPKGVYEVWPDGRMYLGILRDDFFADMKMLESEVIPDRNMIGHLNDQCVGGEGIDPKENILWIEGLEDGNLWVNPHFFEAESRIIEAGNWQLSPDAMRTIIEQRSKGSSLMGICLRDNDAGAAEILGWFKDTYGQESVDCVNGEGYQGEVGGQSRPLDMYFISKEAGNAR